MCLMSVNIYFSMRRLCRDRVVKGDFKIANRCVSVSSSTSVFLERKTSFIQTQVIVMSILGSIEIKQKSKTFCKKIFYRQNYQFRRAFDLSNSLSRLSMSRRKYVHTPISTQSYFILAILKNFSLPIGLLRKSLGLDREMVADLCHCYQRVRCHAGK